MKSIISVVRSEWRGWNGFAGIRSGPSRDWHRKKKKNTNLHVVGMPERGHGRAQKSERKNDSHQTVARTLFGSKLIDLTVLAERDRVRNGCVASLSPNGIARYAGRRNS